MVESVHSRVKSLVAQMRDREVEVTGRYLNGTTPGKIQVTYRFTDSDDVHELGKMRAPSATEDLVRKKVIGLGDHLFHKADRNYVFTKIDENAYRFTTIRKPVQDADSEAQKQ